MYPIHFKKTSKSHIVQVIVLHIVHRLLSPLSACGCFCMPHSPTYSFTVFAHVIGVSNRGVLSNCRKKPYKIVCLNTLIRINNKITFTVPY